MPYRPSWRIPLDSWHRAAASAAAVAMLAASGSVASASDAFAKHGDDNGRVRVVAPCGGLTSELTLMAQQGNVDVSYVLARDQRGRNWRLAITRNGQPIVRAKRTAQAPAGRIAWHMAVPVSSAADVLGVTARSGGTVCSITASLTGANAPQSSSTSVDTIVVSKCYTNATKSTGGELLIKASSSDPNAQLTAYRPDGSVIGVVQNGGGSRYGGTVMPYQSSDPGTVIIKSSSGGSVTVATGPFQL